MDEKERTGRPQEDLASRYLKQEDKDQLDGKKPAGAPSGGLPAFVLGCIFLAAGIALTYKSRQMVYYGAVMAGTALVLEGLYCMMASKPQGRIATPVRVVFWIVGFVVGLVFAIASSH